ncbi:MAG TPA: MBL fold metallo-hydrolase [Candidatus Avamphibacillus sp.]|nr:MBL fold metallo-hydrolase [Candidatus Avamphibacillus sp.]
MIIHYVWRGFIVKVLDKTVNQITIPTPYAVGDAHVYLLKGDTLSLVDTGVKTKEAWEALNTQLREIGYYPHDIEQIILTHHHVDHIGLVDEFPRVEHIVAHENLHSWLTKDKAFFQYYVNFFKKFFANCGVPEEFYFIIEQLQKMFTLGGDGELTATLCEGDTLPGHEEWQVIETKGHAQSHLSFLRASDGTFIGGDHVLQHISSNPLLEPPKMGENNRPRPLLQYRANLEKCLSLGIEVVLPGHGELVTNIDELIQSRLAKQEKRANKVLTLLEHKTLTPFQVCQKLFPKKYQSQLDLTMSETIGQLDYLEAKGLVAKEINDNVFSYYVTKYKE